MKETYNHNTARSWETQVADAYGETPPAIAPAVLAFTASMQAGNGEMMRSLDAIVSAPDSDIPANLRPYMIAALRERHMVMPQGREISRQMQSFLERALIQARLHLMRTPGAAEGFRVAADMYAATLKSRRNRVALHLENLNGDALSSFGAIEWCERLITKFTAQEIVRPDLAVYAGQLRTISDRLGRYDQVASDTLSHMIAFLEMGNDVTGNAAAAVRQSIPGFAVSLPEIHHVSMPTMAQPRRAG